MTSIVIWCYIENKININLTFKRGWEVPLGERDRGNTDVDVVSGVPM